MPFFLSVSKQDSTISAFPQTVFGKFGNVCKTYNDYAVLTNTSQVLLTVDTGAYQASQFVVIYLEDGTDDKKYATVRG